MSDPHVAESEVQVIKSAVLGFVETMNSEKRTVEQQIREKSENIRSSVLGAGSSQFSYQDVDSLARKYKDEYLDFYRNTIHLKMIANASGHIKQSIQQGLIQADIVQQEWLEGFEALQNQINQYQAIADKAEQLETQLEGNKVVAGDVQELQQALAQKDQLIAEKDQEIMNLNEGLARMENQVNDLGQKMLENSMTLEEMQEALNERDMKIHALKQQLSEASNSGAEVELLQQQLQEAKDRERELQQQASSASSDLMSQLQDNLEETREQVLSLRKDLVQKNEELHSLRLEQDEYEVKAKQLNEKIGELRKDKAAVTQERDQLDEKYSELQATRDKLKEELSSAESQVTDLTTKLTTSESRLQELEEKLEGYEGKVAMSTEEQERINSELNNMKDQLSIYQDTITYFRSTLGEDVKFRILALLSTMTERVRLDDLADSITIPEKVTERAILELGNQGVIDTWKEGRFLYCSLNSSYKLPAPLTSET